MDNEDDADIASEITEIALDTAAFPGIPKPLKKTFWKAFARLSTAAVDIPAAHFEGLASEKRAETQARVQLIEASAKQIATQVEMNPEYARVAATKFGNRIIREQLNIDEIVDTAGKLLESPECQSLDNSVKLKNNTEKEIGDDFLNSFEKEAAPRSSDEMKLIFAKILARETVKTGSFSIKAMKTVGMLDARSIEAFRVLCSCVVYSEIDGHTIIGHRVPSLGGNAASNALSKYGLHYTRLCLLEEYGLITSDFNSSGVIDTSIFGAQPGAYPLRFGDEPYFLVPKKVGKVFKEFKLNGVALSTVGQELYGAMERNSQLERKFVVDLIAWFDSMGLAPVRVKTIVDPENGARRFEPVKD